MTNHELQRVIQQAFPDAEVSVSGGEGKFEASVISTAFAGLSTVKQHQRVYAAVNEHIASGVVHALSLRTGTP